MQVKNISLYNFRNIDKAAIEFNDNINILYGKNGQGKTSVLEAIYLLAITKSFRTGSERVLLQHNKEALEIKGVFEKQSQEKIQLRLYYSPAEGKNVFFNGNKLNKYSELIGAVPVTLLSMGDLDLSFGVPTNRRRFLDILLAQTSSVYLKSLQIYRKSLQQRNRLLSLISEKKETVDNLFPWDRQLAQYGTDIILYRINLLDSLNKSLDFYYKQISKSDDHIEIKYKSTLVAEADKFSRDEYQARYLELLKKNIEADILRKSTGTGLHRDDLLFMKNGYVLKAYGSQGENKTFLIALKLAEKDFIKQKTGKEAILLLDDIFGELDKERINFLMDHVTDQGQTFITTTLKSKFEKSGLQKENFFLVDAGKIIQ